MANKKLSEEEFEEAIDRYKNSEPVTEIVKDYPIAYSTFYSYLERYDVDSRQKRLTDGEEKEICELYKSGESSVEISNKFDVSPDGVRRVLKRNGVERRNQKEAQRQYELDDTVFEEINEESAYWLGFLMADGCVSQKKNDSYVISLHVATKDKEHLEKFRDFLNSNHPIHDRTTYGGYSKGSEFSTITLHSDKLAKDLKSYGVVERKSMSAEVNDRLKDNRHFWRGVVDGDGYLKEHDVTVSVDLVGSKNLLKQFKEFVTSFCSTKSSVLEHKSIYRYMVCGSNVASTVISKLYSNCSVYLDRKKETAIRIINQHSDDN